MRREITDLHRQNKRLIRTLSKLGVAHSLEDKLFPIPQTAITNLSGEGKTKDKTEAMRIKRQMIVEEPNVGPEIMEIETDLQKEPSRYGDMNSERKRLIEEHGNANNLLTNLTPADIAIKENAFKEDFKLPISPA